jgi:serine/threonine protein kinase
VEGTPFGRYRLITLLGPGGMGEVWRAYDTETQRMVALKVLPEHLATDSQFEQRFRREAFAAAGLADPHVVPIHYFGEIDGRLYVDMRLIEGRDLQRMLADGPLAPDRAVAIISQIASALHAAHQIGLVHRDVKPSNILVAEDDFAYLIDFGIARAVGDTKLTGTGNVIGTLAYLAPERLTSGQTDPRADIYALACVLHECLTGSEPFPGNSIEELIAAHVSAPPPRPSVVRRDVPIGLDSVIAKGMAKDPATRYSTVREMANAARAAITDPIIQPRPMPPAPPPAAPQTQRQKNRLVIAGLVAVVTVLVVVAVGAVYLFNHGGQGGSSPATTKPNAAPRPNTGPFTGSYTANIGPKLNMAGKPRAGARPTTETWAMRSMCRPAGCVATASRKSGPNNGQTPLPSLVFDNVGGHWLAAGTTPGTCKNAPSDRFFVITLQPQRDTSLTGNYYILTSAGCFDSGTVTFTRTGDVDVSGLPDPAREAPRVVSPAEALHGQYHTEITFMRGLRQDYDYGVQTYCLRTAQKCMSFFIGPSGNEPLTFANGQWTRTDRYEASCPQGGTSHVKMNATYPLPQPPQNPIARLTGHGFKDETGSTCVSGDFDQTFTRTGD